MTTSTTTEEYCATSRWLYQLIVLDGYSSVPPGSLGTHHDHA